MCPCRHAVVREGPTEPNGYMRCQLERTGMPQIVPETLCMNNTIDGESVRRAHMRLTNGRRQGSWSNGQYFNLQEGEAHKGADEGDCHTVTGTKVDKSRCGTGLVGRVSLACEPGQGNRCRGGGRGL